MKNLIYTIPALLLFAAACSEDPVEPKTQDDGSGIALSTTTLSFLNTGEAVDGAASVTVTSNADWTLIGKDDWCHPSVTEGKNGESVIFTADANPGAESRTAEFFFVSGSKTEKLYVMQKQNSVIELFKDEFDLPREGGDIAVRVSANEEVTVNIPAEYQWITRVETPASKSLDLNVFYFHIAETDEYEQREGKIEFMSGGNTVPATVTQERQIELRVEQATYDAGANGGIVEVTVHTNLPYSVDVPDVTSSWLTPDLDENASTDPGTITTRTERFTVGTQGEMTRAGKITLTSLDGSLTTSFVIRQRGSNPKTIEIPDENFRQALADISYVIIDGYEAPECELSDLGQNATEMNVSGKNIESIEGIRNFPNVQNLDCSNNNITKMDFSGTKVYTDYYNNYSKLYGNPIEELIGGDYIQYVMLNCADGNTSEVPGNGLTGANGVSSKKLRLEGSAIASVYVQYNPALEKVDISSCAKLNSIYYLGATGCGINNPPFRAYFPTGTYISDWGVPDGCEYIAGPPTDW